MFVYPRRKVKERGLEMPPAGNQLTMLTAVVIAFCVVLLVLAFLAPRLSRYFQRAGDKPLQLGERGAGEAPGKLGRWFQKPFETARKAVRKSGSKGREERAKLDS
jgi:hypothetical protein